MAESVTRFLGEDASLGSTIQGLEGRLDGFGQSVNGVGEQTSALPAAFKAAVVGIAAFVASVAAAALGVKTFSTALDFAEKLDNLRDATGASRAELVLLQRVFDLTGSSADKVGPALNKVQELIAKAADNSPKAVEKLGILGLKLGELKDLSPAEQFEKVVQAIDKLPTPAERARAAMAVFGTQLGRELMPLITDLDGEMAKASKTLGSLPAIVDEYGPAMSRFGDAIDALKKKPQEFAVGVVGPMSAVLGSLALKFAEFDASGFGKNIGEALNKALIQMLYWAEDAYKLFSGIWKILLPAIEPVLSALTTKWESFIDSLSPYVQKISSYFASLNFSAIGQKIGEQFAFAFDVAMGLWADPSKIFGLYARYIDFIFRKAADDFLSYFVTAVEALGRITLSLFGTDFWGSISKIFANALILGIAQINLRFLDMIQNTMRFFASMWDAVTGAGVSGFAKMLFNLVKNFGSDLFSALTNPVAFFSGKLASALIDGTKSGADAYKTNFDNATGGIIQRARAGLEGVSTQAAKNMGDGFREAGNSLVSAVSTAVSKTEGFKSNIFGSAEAGQRLSSYASDIALKGQQYKESLNQAANSMQQAKMDVVAPDGIAPTLTRTAQTLNYTAEQTQAASRSITTAYWQVVDSGQRTSTNITQAGANFVKSAQQAGESLQKGVANALRELTTSQRGMATEKTLQNAVNQLILLNRKLPQSVLI